MSLEFQEHQKVNSQPKWETLSLSSSIQDPILREGDSLDLNDMLGRFPAKQPFSSPSSNALLSSDFFTNFDVEAKLKNKGSKRSPWFSTAWWKKRNQFGELFYNAHILCCEICRCSKTCQKLGLSTFRIEWHLTT